MAAVALTVAMDGTIETAFDIESDVAVESFSRVRNHSDTEYGSAEEQADSFLSVVACRVAYFLSRVSQTLQLACTREWERSVFLPSMACPDARSGGAGATVSVVCCVKTASTSLQQLEPLRDGAAARDGSIRVVVVVAGASVTKVEEATASDDAGTLVGSCRLSLIPALLSLPVLSLPLPLLWPAITVVRPHPSPLLFVMRGLPTICCVVARKRSCELRYLSDETRKLLNDFSRRHHKEVHRSVLLPPLLR